MTHVRRLLLALLVLNFLLPPQAHAAESYDNCTGFIDSLPATISTQGTWCLRQDLSTAIVQGNAITVATNNVTIDCNDFKLGGLAAGTGTGASGIYADNRLNVTVRHCTVRGFREGVVLGGWEAGGGHVVEDNRFDGNTFGGIKVQGDGSVVQRNLVRDTGGSTSWRWSAGGIFVTHTVDVLDNTVSGVMPTPSSDGIGDAYGIHSYGNSGGSIRGNRVRGLVRLGDGGTYGIYNAYSGRISLDGNHVVDDASGAGIGMYCADGNGRAKDNIVNGFATGISGCGDAGGNDLTP